MNPAPRKASPIRTRCSFPDRQILTKVVALVADTRRLPHDGDKLCSQVSSLYMPT